MDIDKMISNRLNAAEVDLKQALELILEAHSNNMLIEYLMLLKNEQNEASALVPVKSKS